MLHYKSEPLALSCIQTRKPKCPNCGKFIIDYNLSLYSGLEDDEIEPIEVKVALCPNCGVRFLIQMFIKTTFNTFKY